MWRPWTYSIPEVTVSLVREPSGTRMSRKEINSPDAASKAFMDTLPDDGREHFRIALVDIRQRLIALHTVSIGCLTTSIVHAREVFRPAILAGAAGIVLSHNHPSGDPEPSTEDLALTRRLAAAGRVVGIEVLDHLVIGNGSGQGVSLKERGVI